MQKQLELLKLRYSHSSFDFDSNVEFTGEGSKFIIKWTKDDNSIQLDCDLADLSYKIK